MNSGKEKSPARMNNNEKSSRADGAEREIQIFFNGKWRDFSAFLEVFVRNNKKYENFNRV